MPQIGVVPETGFQASSQPGLFGIQFPWVQIQHQGLLLVFKLPESQLRVLERKDPEISAASRRQCHARQSQGCRRKLQNCFSILANVQMRIALRAGNAVEIMADRIDAGIVCKTFLGQNL